MNKKGKTPVRKYDQSTPPKKKKERASGENTPLEVRNAAQKVPVQLEIAKTPPKGRKREVPTLKRLKSGGVLGSETCLPLKGKPEKGQSCRRNKEETRLWRKRTGTGHQRTFPLKNWT